MGGWLRDSRSSSVHLQSSRDLAESHCVRIPRKDLLAEGTLSKPHPVVSVSFGNEEVAKRNLSRQLTIVGRCRPCCLHIESLDLSTVHLALYWEAGTLWVVDLLSRNGTQINGHFVDASEFPLGGVLGLGEVTLRYAAGGTVTTVPMRQIATTTAVRVNEARETRSQPPVPSLHDGQSRQAESSKRLEEIEVRAAAVLARQKTWEAARRAREEAVADGARRLAEEEVRLARDRDVFEKDLAAWKEKRACEERIAAERNAAERTSLEKSRAELQDCLHALVQQQAELQRHREQLQSKRQQQETDRKDLASQGEVIPMGEQWSAEWRRRETELRQERDRLGALQSDVERQHAELLQARQWLEAERSKIAAARWTSAEERTGGVRQKEGGAGERSIAARGLPGKGGEAGRRVHIDSRSDDRRNGGT